MDRPARFLGGYRVLDLTDEQGMLCGKILGDLGADVIKIERPGGDPARSIGPFYLDIPDPQKSLYWMAANTSKRGITLDITRTDGKALFKELAKTADFVVESFVPGYLADLGLGYDDLEKVKPSLVLTSISPFGQDGPRALYKASDLTIWAMGGMAYVTGSPDRAPLQVSVPQAYFLGGIQAATGSMVAHHSRRRTGEGQWVDVSIQQAVVLTLCGVAEAWDVLSVNRRREGSSWVALRNEVVGHVRFRLVWQCEDGYVYWNLGLAGGARSGHTTSSKAIVQWMIEDGVAGDLASYDWTQFDTSTIPVDTVRKMEDLFVAFFKTKTKAELFERAVAKAMVLAPVNTVEDLYHSPQLTARDYLVPVRHDELGEVIIYPGPPVKDSKGSWAIDRRAPLIGEHNEEIYRELGLSTNDLVRLKQTNVI